MTDTRIDLATHLDGAALPQGLSELLALVASACVDIRKVVSGGALAGALGASGSVNVQDEEQKKLDVISNDILTDTLLASPLVAGVASEEMDNCQPAPHAGGKFLVLFDPLDGSSNIDINAPVGTIFSVLAAPEGDITDASFLQDGRKQLAAGYVLYGGQTMLVLTLSQGVNGFTLDAEIAPATGARRWMRLIAAPVCEGGEVVRLQGLKFLVPAA